MGTIRILRRFVTRGRADGEYVCQSCLTEFSQQCQVCPDCGGFDIRRSEWLEPYAGDGQSETST